MARYAFVAAYSEQTLTVIDVTNPLNPAYVTSIATDRLRKLAYDGGILYGLSSSDASLSCIDASITPSVLGFISGAGPPNFLQAARFLAVRGNYCYISAGI